jgi:hypothetical protein
MTIPRPSASGLKCVRRNDIEGSLTLTFTSGSDLRLTTHIYTSRASHLTGQFWTLRSSDSGVQISTFGTSGDFPVAASYVR